MASNFGQLCRDLIGGSLTIKGKRVIDEKGNMKPYDLTVRQTLTVNGDTCLNNASINNIDILSLSQLYDITLIQRGIFDSENFVGEYAEENWTIDLQGGSVTFDPSGNTITMVSADMGNTGPEVDTSACITKAFDEKMNIYFTWNYTTADIDGPEYDPFGYQLNGVFNQLTSDDFGNVGNVQSGCEIVCVPPQGQFTFCFNQRSTDQNLGPATTVISNFKVGRKSKIVGKKSTDEMPISDVCELTEVYPRQAFSNINMFPNGRRLWLGVPGGDFTDEDFRYSYLGVQSSNKIIALADNELNPIIYRFNGNRTYDLTFGNVLGTLRISTRDSTPSLMDGQYIPLTTTAMHYYVWFNVDNSTPDPVPYGAFATGIEVNIDSGDNTTNIRDKMSAAINALPDFSTVNLSTEIVTINNTAGIGFQNNGGGMIALENLIPGINQTDARGKALSVGIDDSIYVMTQWLFPQRLSVAKILPDGSGLDTTYNGIGYTTLIDGDFQGYYYYSRHMILLPDQTIVAIYDDPVDVPKMTRWSTAGVPMWTITQTPPFGAGQQAINLDYSATASRIYLSHANFAGSFAIVAYDFNGNVDMSFGVSGISTYVAPVGPCGGIIDNNVANIKVGPDGYIYCPVSAYPTTAPPCYESYGLYRVDQNGVLDTTYGDNGLFIWNRGELNDYISAWLVHVIFNPVNGHTFNIITPNLWDSGESDSRYNVVILEVDSTGTLVNTLYLANPPSGVSGYATWQYAYDAIPRPDGTIVWSGEVFSNGSASEFFGPVIGELTCSAITYNTQTRPW